MFWKIVGALFLADKAQKFDEMDEAMTRGRPSMSEREADRQIEARMAQLRRELEQKRQRLAAAKQFEKHRDRKPFRVFTNNAFGTTALWLQGRKLFAETYDDGRRKGYVVYEGIDMDMRFYSIEQFHARFNRWVESAPELIARSDVSPSDLQSVRPRKSKRPDTHVEL